MKKKGPWFGRISLFASNIPYDLNMILTKRFVVWHWSYQLHHLRAMLLKSFVSVRIPKCWHVMGKENWTISFTLRQRQIKMRNPSSIAPQRKPVYCGSLACQVSIGVLFKNNTALKGSVIMPCGTLWISCPKCRSGFFPGQWCPWKLRFTKITWGKWGNWAMRLKSQAEMMDRNLGKFHSMASYSSGE